MKNHLLIFAFAVSFITVVFAGCSSSKAGGQIEPLPEPSNLDYGLSRTENLDFIFNTQTLGKTTIVIKRSEWNRLCDDYRYFYKNENCVHAELYVYEKDGRAWTLENVGFRLRGNTSRICPQGIDNGREQGQKSYSWNPDYFHYAEKTNDDYRQSHFKVDFEEFLADDDEQKMAGCMKGVALKRMDNSCTREIFCYDLFRKNGIWTAPRASHTRLLLNIIEDLEDNSVTTVNFGVYEMFEEVNKQSLKERDSENNTAANAWKNNKGYLWKGHCDLTSGSIDQAGVEDIRIFYQGETMEGKNLVHKEDGNGRIGYVFDSYNLDLKTNKDKLESAKKELNGFIKDLNNLPDVADENDVAAIEEIKAFYEKWFDMDFFLKTYAINILCGMDDDYWGNKNNYYLYFDTGKNGTGKVYFIPFDYDNSLGNSIFEGGFEHNPLDWGRGEDRPLMDKLIQVPEYKQKSIDYLLEVSSNEYWNYERCSQLFKNWGTMCSPYLYSPDLNCRYIGVNHFYTDYIWCNPGYSLVHKYNNLYDATRKSFEKWLVK